MLMVLLLWLSACHTGHDHEPSHDHTHDEVKLIVTAYGEYLEAFAEADPLAVGTPSVFGVHLTRLSDFKPLEADKVALRLVSEGQDIHQEMASALRPGVFRIELQPQQAGSHQLFFEIEWAGRQETIEAGVVQVYDNLHRAIHAAEDLQTDIPGAVAFTKEHSWGLSFATALVQAIPFGPTIRTVGEVLPAQGEEFVLVSPATGMARLSDRPLYEGQSIASGEAVLYIDGGALSENNPRIRYLEARNLYERRKADYERMEALAADQLVSRRELLQARQEYLDAKAVYDNLMDIQAGGSLTVNSPSEGSLTQLLVSHGEHVSAGQPLAVISRNNRLVVRAEVQQRHAGMLELIYDANLGPIHGSMRRLSELNGRVLSVARNVHPGSHLLPVHLELPSQDGLVPGGLLDVYLIAREEEPVQVVPNSALLEEQGNYFVFVQVHPESFVKREVQTGETDGQLTRILGGLAAGERIVSRGAILVKMAATSGDLDPHSGHVH